MLFDFKLGQGSIVLRVKIRNSSLSTGAGLTGLTSASSGLIISTIADNEATATAYTVAGSTIESITTLGTYAAPTATKCRFKEVDAINHKGLYEIQIADARFAVANAKSVTVSISGATNVAECDVVVPLRTVDPYSASFGLSLAKTTNITGFNDIAATAIVTGGAITTSSGAVSTVTTLTNLPAIPNNWLTAAGIAASALNGKGDWLTTLGTNAPAGWLNAAAFAAAAITMDTFSVDAWQLQTRRVDITGTTTPVTADTYKSYGFFNNRTYFKSTTLGTPIFLWYDGAGTWTLSATLGTNGSAYFTHASTIFDGNYSNQGTATGTPVAAAHGGAMLANNQYPTTFEALTVNGATTLADGLVISRSSVNQTALTITGNGSGNAVLLTGGSFGSPVVQITGGGGNADAVKLSPSGSGKGINGTLTTVDAVTNKVAATLAAADVTGVLPANTQQIAGQTASASGTVTFPAATLASTTGPVGSVTGAVGSVTTTVNATLVSTGLDAIPTTRPASATTLDTWTFREMAVMAGYFASGEQTMPDTVTNSGTDKLTWKAGNSSTVIATQVVTDDGTTQRRQRVVMS